jgi:hypothetical protein
VRNPLRSEQEAFQWVLLTVVAFALIVIGALINTWVGLAVFIVITLVALWYLTRGREERPPPMRPTMQHSEDERRILVIANETVGAEALRECIQKKSEGVRENVLVVSPALSPSAVRHWASDEDPGRAEAQQRLDESLARLRQGGISARGEVGDSEPLQAIEDALRTFGADEIIISTHPEGKSRWLERGIVSAARERFAVPITHVVAE